MRTTLTGRNFEISPSLRQLITRRLAKLDRMLNESIVSSQVVLSREKYRRVIELTVHARGDHVLRGIGDASSWPLSVREAVEKVSQQGHRLKDKWEKRKRRASGARASRPPAPPKAAPGAGRPKRIVRAARYVVKPMTVEDAALRIEASEDAFLVFRNAQTDGINIVYRRKGGALGLIEPER